MRQRQGRGFRSLQAGELLQFLYASVQLTQFTALQFYRSYHSLCPSAFPFPLSRPRSSNLPCPGAQTNGFVSPPAECGIGPGGVLTSVLCRSPSGTSSVRPASSLVRSSLGDLRRRS